MADINQWAFRNKITVPFCFCESEYDIRHLLKNAVVLRHFEFRAKYCRNIFEVEISN